MLLNQRCSKSKLSELLCQQISLKHCNGKINYKSKAKTERRQETSSSRSNCDVLRSILAWNMCNLPFPAPSFLPLLSLWHFWQSTNIKETLCISFFKKPLSCLCVTHWSTHFHGSSVALRVESASLLHSLALSSLNPNCFGKQKPVLRHRRNISSNATFSGAGWGCWHHRDTHAG